MTTVATGLLSVLVGVGIMTTEARAQQNLELKLSHRRLDNGTYRREPIVTGEFAPPSNFMEYKIEYRIVTIEPLKKVVLVFPIPAGLEYLQGSAQPSSAQASLDGKSYASMPLTRKVTDDSGNEREVLVPPSEYRYLGWSIRELQPDAAGALIARMRVMPVPISKATRYRGTP